MLLDYDINMMHINFIPRTMKRPRTIKLSGFAPNHETSHVYQICQGMHTIPNQVMSFLKSI